MFYIGQHETKRVLPVTDELVHHAQDLGVCIHSSRCRTLLTWPQYDMLTTPITNSHFHARVLSLLSSYNQAISDTSLPPSAQPLPLIPALESVDTPLGPSDSISQIVTYTSAWIDLSSPDPVIAHLSRHVFNLEIAYAAFCGVVTVVVPGPRLSHGPDGVAQYARALKEALSTGAYLQLHVSMPIDGSSTTTVEDDLGDLAQFARPEFTETTTHTPQSHNPSSSWDAWNAIRSICRYHNRLSLGEKYIDHTSLGSH
jgi:protein arginine N-methyltransferase 5